MGVQSQQYEITVIGGGKMGGALVKGWIKNHIFSPDAVFVVDPDPNRKREFDSLGVALYPVLPPEPPTSPMVLWAVKPQVLRPLVREYSHFYPQSLHISIAAGVLLHDLVVASSSGSIHPRWLRAMPNQPVVVGEGVIALYTNTELKGEERHRITEIFAAVGKVFWMSKEEDLHMITAISGSGPAYVALFAEALEEAGVFLGLGRELARTLALYTIRGAICQMSEEEITPTELKERVTSPGGTTSRALFTLEKERFRAAVIEAVQSAWERSQELAKEKRL